MIEFFKHAIKTVANNASAKTSNLSAQKNQRAKLQESIEDAINKNK